MSRLKTAIVGPILSVTTLRLGEKKWELEDIQILSVCKSNGDVVYLTIDWGFGGQTIMAWHEKEIFTNQKSWKKKQEFDEGNLSHEKDQN